MDETTETIETFDDFDGMSENSHIESFDDLSDEPETSTEEDFDDENVGAGESTKMTSQLEPQEDQKEVKESVEEADEEEAEEEEAEEEEDPNEESTATEVEEDLGKNINAFHNGEKVEIPEDLELIVPVDGKRERVSLSELKSNYSGKVAWDKKFTELGQHRKEFEGQVQKFTTERDQVVGALSNARNLVDQALRENGDPRAAVNNIVDLLGINPYDFNVALMSSMAEEIIQLTNMTDGEKTAYWAQKENEYLKTRQESLMKSRQSEQANQANRRKVDELRQAHGVSEESFTQAVNELAASGVEGITAEMAIERAQLSPIVDQALDLVAPFVESLTDDEQDSLVMDITKVIKNNPDLPLERIQERLAEEFKVAPLVNKLEKRTKTSSAIIKPVKTQKKENVIESFDDFDDY